MAMKNYKVEYGDGTTQFYQFEDDDPGLELLKAAAKDRDADVKSVTQADPKPAPVDVS